MRPLHEENIERIFSEAFENAELTPDADLKGLVMDSIDAKMQGADNRKRRRFFFILLLIGGLSISTLLSYSNVNKNAAIVKSATGLTQSTFDLQPPFIKNDQKRITKVYFNADNAQKTTGEVALNVRLNLETITNSQLHYSSGMVSGFDTNALSEHNNNQSEEILSADSKAPETYSFETNSIETNEIDLAEMNGSSPEASESKAKISEKEIVNHSSTSADESEGLVMDTLSNLAEHEEVDSSLLTSESPEEKQADIQKEKDKASYNLLSLRTDYSLPFNRNFELLDAAGNIQEGEQSNRLGIELDFDHYFENGLTISSGIRFDQWNEAHDASTQELKTPGFWEYIYAWDVDLIDSDDNGEFDGLDFDGDGSSDFDMIEGEPDSDGNGIPDYMEELLEEGIAGWIIEKVIDDSTYIDPVYDILQKEERSTIMNYGIPVFFGYSFTLTPKLYLNGQLGMITSFTRLKHEIKHIMPELPPSIIISNHWTFTPTLRAELMYFPNNFGVSLGLNINHSVPSFKSDASVKRTRYGFGLGLHYRL